MTRPASLAAALLAGALVSACDDPAGPTARIVVIADTHVIGPQYTTPVEDSPSDNESIVLTPSRLASVRDRVNALDPAPDAVVVLGDVVHASHHAQDVAWYEANPSGYSVAKELLDGFAMPVHALMGNHDYAMGCGNERYPRALSEELFQRFFGAAPYYAIELAGVKLYFLNGQRGRTWDPASPDCDTFYASYGADQLAWLDAELDDGKPAILLSHYAGLLWEREENPGSPGQEDLVAVIAAHDNVRLFLSGHIHRWLDFSEIMGHEHYVVGATRFDDDNFWVLEVDGDRGSVTIPDRDKAIWSNSCAETFTYDGVPRVIPGAPETGTCVTGLE